MNKQSVLIFKLPELFKILNELKNYLDFDIYNISQKEFPVPTSKILNFKVWSF